MFSQLKYLVVGSGLFGSVIAERIAHIMGEHVVVLEKRNDIGGNCHSSLDAGTGIEVHTYGSHIFHTADQKVWDYINRFTSFTGYRHHVFTRHEGRAYPMPISLATINSYFCAAYSPEEARQLIRKEIEQAGIVSPSNLEEKAISLIGPSLYHAFIKGYTSKQWGTNPRNLPENIITRLPVRFNYNTDYFNDPYQGVPAEGYFSLFRNLLSHPLIDVRTGTDFEEIRDLIPDTCTVIYTGMIDRFFHNRFGALDWRSLRFENEKINGVDYQGCSVMNYADESVPWTRIHEFKHYNPERTQAFQSPQTLICREYPQTYAPGQEAYYPVNDERNRALYRQYEEAAAALPGVLFGGRLGAYQYWDMDKTIAQALLLFETRILPESGTAL